MPTFNFKTSGGQYGIKISFSNENVSASRKGSSVDKYNTRPVDKADQMAEWYGASASGSVDLGFDSESGQTNDFKIGIHSFPA